TAQRQNTVITWILRAVGFGMMWFGLSLLLRPLSVVAGVLPILGSIVGFGTGLVAGLVALPCAALTVAMAWIAYRPVLGIGLMLAAAGIIAAVVMKMRGRASRTAEGTGTPTS